MRIELALTSREGTSSRQLQGWAQAMRAIVLTGQRVMGPKHVAAKRVFSPERAR
ncbi:hypothetical protein [Pandoraea anapnoica]|uniref:hypothetical protein n=1 Tax=Pandoraea anapnoica TaxID=2508301 RepID=UPI00158403CC|nr:hypothetical protein [Pandoraea anapnoica]